METNFNEFLIESAIKALRCFLNPVNNEIIELLSQHEFLKRNEIPELLNIRDELIGNNIKKLKDNNIIYRVYRTDSYYYTLNKEMIDKVLNFTKLFQ